MQPATLLAVVFVCVFQQAFAEPIRKMQCNETVLDQCGHNLYPFQDGPTLPQNREQLKENCPNEFATLNCVTHYTEQCLTGLRQVMFSVLINSITEYITPKCTDDSVEERGLLKHATCLNKAGAVLHECYVDYMIELAAIASIRSPKTIDYACCSLSGYKKCSLKAIFKVCDADHVEYFNSLLNHYSSEVMQAVCSKYNSVSPVCTSLPPLIVPQKPPSLSFFIPLLKILSNLNI